MPKTLINRIDAHIPSQIKFARGSRGKQFILITPQSMSKVSPNDRDVRVNKYVYPRMKNALVSVANKCLGCVILNVDKRSLPSLLCDAGSSMRLCQPFSTYLSLCYVYQSLRQLELVLSIITLRFPVCVVLHLSPRHSPLFSKLCLGILHSMDCQSLQAMGMHCLLERKQMHSNSGWTLLIGSGFKPQGVELLQLVPFQISMSNPLHPPGQH